VVLHAVPSPHPRFDAGLCFRELVADLARGRFGGWANRLERFAATYACRAAVKAGERLDQREMRELLLRLFATDLPPHDVHGRALVDPGTRYSAGHFARDAEGWLADVRARGRQPVVVGGTGLYVRALAEGLFREPALDPARRRSLDAFTARLEPLELLRWAG